MVLTDAHDRKSSWRRATRGAKESSSISQTTPNKEEKFPSRQKIYFSDFFENDKFEFIDTNQRDQEDLAEISTFDRKMAKNENRKFWTTMSFERPMGLCGEIQ